MLVLTADHCLDANNWDLDAIDDPDGSDIVFMWKAEKSGCGTGTIDEFTTVGAIVLANNSTTDFTIFELNEYPQQLSNPYYPYYLGWDRGTPSDGGKIIHHPRGDVKKISTYTTALSTYGTYRRLLSAGGFTSTTNGRSIVEPGSSGGPLFSSDQLVIGQVWGILSGGSPVNCSTINTYNTTYGKLSESWDIHATLKERRLMDWLDPENDDPDYLGTTNYYSIFDATGTPFNYRGLLLIQ